MLPAEEKYRVLKIIYRSAYSVVFKALNLETNENVIIKTLNCKFNDPIPAAIIKNQYAFLKKLESEYVVKAYELVKLDNIFSVVMEDFDGISLEEYIKSNRFGISELLDVAQKIIMCVKYVHNNNVIHKDINPSNIIYNPNTQAVKLIGFGIAAEINAVAMNPDKLEGTLPYVSPEQTGRMNRPVDYRTDFYSLGITLYELASGQLPFNSSDAAEMVHFHIAKSAIPVHEINSDIPKAVSAIIAKLMAKIPEHRYKNADGILFDIKQCRKLLGRKQLISEFKLGSRDLNDKFEIPKKLYGRETEITKLLSLVKGMSDGNAGLILVGGYAGIGKTALVNELYKPLKREQGIFISGKFDQFNKEGPFSALLKAMDQFCRYVLFESDLDIDYWKSVMLSAFEGKGALLTEAVPRLAAIVGEQPKVKAAASRNEMQASFKYMLQKWLGAIAAPKRPVVIFIDDVQWADVAFLELMDRVLADRTISGLVVICAYRDNDVKLLPQLGKTIENAKLNLHNSAYVQLANLDINAVVQMASDITRCSQAEVLAFAQAVHVKTWGNPFYTIEFLKYCYQAGFIYYHETDKTWRWDNRQICSSKITDNVADFLIARMGLLPEMTRELLAIAACIGNSFNSGTLLKLTNRNMLVLESALASAVAAEFIYMIGDGGPEPGAKQYNFCHDRFQQAGYDILTEEQRKKIHLSLAKYYEDQEQQEKASYLYKIAEHYAKALEIIVDRGQRRRSIYCLLKAAHAAHVSAAFDTA